MINQDLEHIGELGDLKDTKYWFQRDLQTMKKGLNSAIGVLPYLITVALIVSVITNCIEQTLFFSTVVLLAVMIFPIIFLGYFLFYIMVNKGYNIHSSGGGTVIDDSRGK